MTKYTKKTANKSTKSKAISPSNDLPIIQQNACGIDVGAESIFVCVPRDRDSTPIREFTAFTADLRAMAEWLPMRLFSYVAMCVIEILLCKEERIN
jgi:transposase